MPRYLKQVEANEPAYHNAPEDEGYEHEVRSHCLGWRGIVQGWEIGQVCLGSGDGDGIGDLAVDTGSGLCGTRGGG